MIFEQCDSLTITELRRFKLLVAGHSKSGIIRFSVGGQPTGSVWVYVDAEDSYGELHLSYTSDGESIEYSVPLVTVRSNLGKGYIWYFRCPSTQKRCRILYCAGKYFLHRAAYDNCIYRIQTSSKLYRPWEQMIMRLRKADELEKELQKKYSKTHYLGLPTRKYRAYLKYAE